MLSANGCARLSEPPAVFPCCQMSFHQPFTYLGGGTVNECQRVNPVKEHVCPCRQTSVPLCQILRRSTPYDQMEAMTGFEPVTFRLTAECSAAELHCHRRSGVPLRKIPQSTSLPRSCGGFEDDRIMWLLAAVHQTPFTTAALSRKTTHCRRNG